MRIVIDTNVIVSGIFFGGRPGDLLQLVLTRQVEAIATSQILAEYQATIHCLLKRYGGTHLHFSMLPLFTAMEVIPQTESIKICRDPDDDKFISCVVDGRCIYIVSGDKDLLSLGQYGDVEILTVTQFFEKYKEIENNG